jgi:nitrogen fixation/metabolism regulation signal transduction histidine kinase
MSRGRTLVVIPDLRESDSVSQVVDNSLVEFDRLKEQQVIVRQIGFLTLGGLTFLLIFASSWTAFYIARGLTVPIKALAEGADQIARGNLSHRVNVPAEDELALLVDSFNQMSGRLEANSAAISEGRRYIETVLQSLPTGVISFDSENRVSTINNAAKKILRLENADFRSFDLATLVNEDNRIVLERLISRAKRVGHAAEQTILQRENVGGLANPDANIPAALIATVLPGGNGTVLVIEDLSELIAAQRASAWQEVARRMAHEIKNPLTPIQLSAERIAKKFASEQSIVVGLTGAVGEGDLAGRIIKEGTDTILREVQSLKGMVDEFSRFARLPNAVLEPGSVNDVLAQVAAIYEGRSEDVDFEFRLGVDVPEAMIDPEQLKRVFVNLIENSIEAFDEGNRTKQIVVSSHFDPARATIIASVADNGPGIDPANVQRLFQPYFSTKGRGTGLGLAIVNRIIVEHNAKIRVASNKPSGAKFTIEIPVAGING